MFKSSGNGAVDDETSLATRAAWLYYVGGHRQEDIALRLGVSRIKVNRLIALAHREGLVRVFVEGTPAECVRLEDELGRLFGLSMCSVAPDVGDPLEEGLPLHTLGVAAARWLQRRLEDPELAVVGVGHGRTLAAVVERLPRIARPDLRFVSLLGSLNRKAAANPFDVIQRLAERTGAEGYFLPVPFFADTIEDKAVLGAQRAVRTALDLATRVDLVVMGIGEVTPNARMVRDGMMTETEFTELRRLGAVGEALGTYVDLAGRPVDADLNRRLLAVPIDILRGREVIAVSGGAGKVEAIVGVLRTGLVTGLVTDEPTAAQIVTLAQRPKRSGR